MTLTMTSGLSLNLTKPASTPEPEAKKEKLTADQTRVLFFIEQTYFESGTTPVESVTARALGLSVDYVKSCWRNTFFLEELKNRGIDLSKQDDLGVLEPKQLALANLLMNVHDKTSIRQKLEVLRVSPQQYNAWMRNPHFQGYLRKRAEETFKGSDPDAYMALIAAVQRGDVKAIQLFFEMRGIYNPRVQVDVNIEVLLVKVVEIVSKHVKDERILNAIAADMEQLGNG